MRRRTPRGTPDGLPEAAPSSAAVREQHARNKQQRNTKPKVFPEKPLPSEIFEKTAKPREPPLTRSIHPLPAGAGPSLEPLGWRLSRREPCREPPKADNCYGSCIWGIPHSYSTHKIPTSNRLADRTSPPCALPTFLPHWGAFSSAQGDVQRCRASEEQETQCPSNSWRPNADAGSPRGVCPHPVRPRGQERTSTQTAVMLEV